MTGMLHRMVRGPVAAVPVTGRATVMIRAGGGTVQLAGHCGLCDARVDQTAGGRIAYRPAGRRRFLVGRRRWVVLGEEQSCGRCEYPVTWMVSRREAQRWGIL